MAAREAIDLSEFNPELFIGLRKNFPSGDGDDIEARGAREALAAVLAVPKDIHHIPEPDLPILDFVALELPQQLKIQGKYEIGCIRSI
jgi:hypothetical protein